MQDHEIDALVDEVSIRLRQALRDNKERQTFARRHTVPIMGQVSKSLWRLMQLGTNREEDTKEILDAIAYLVILYKIRKEPYGEF